jgi:RimJ/RimL family protein N-acetyltransferase
MSAPTVDPPAAAAIRRFCAAARFARLAERSARHRSPRLRLRPVALEDASPLWQATRHGDFNTWLTWPQPQRRAELDSRVERLVAAQKRHEACLLSAIESATGRWVGLYRIAPDLWLAPAGWFELGMWVHPDFWGSGFAAELHALGTTLAFAESDAPGLSARTAEANAKASRTLERLGFERRGDCEIAVEGAAPHAGRIYRLDRADWERAIAPPAAA